MVNSFSDSTYRRSLRPAWAALAIIVCVALTRSLYISLYGSEAPFWDQWDFLQNTLIPWKNGSLQFKELLAPHNEHRILYTRLFSMALLTLDGGTWSNLTEVYANTFVYASILALSYILLCHDIYTPIYKWFLFISVIVVGCLPFDWENNLVGFQNQFYFMLASVIIGAGIAAHSKLSSSISWLLLLVSIAALFTMASGLLTAPTIAAVLALRSWKESVRPSHLLLMFAALFVIALSGIVATPDIDGHHALEAQGIAEHLHAFLTMLAWPVQPLTLVKSVFVVIIWLPALIWFLRYFTTAKASHSEIFAAGIAVWTLLQALAFAHARGHNPTGLPSRYMPIPAIGLLANLALAIRLALESENTHLRRCVMSASVAAGVTLVALALAWRTPDDIESMKKRHRYNLIENFYTQSYLRTKDATFLNHPSLMISYPSSSRLQEFLDESSIQQTLPPSLQVNWLSRGTSNEDVRAGRIAIVFERLQMTVQEGLGLNYLGSTLPTFMILSNSSITAADSPIGSCSIETINGQSGVDLVLQNTNDLLNIEGWFITPFSSSSDRFVILLRGAKQYVLEVSPSGGRHNIVKTIRSQISQTVGFHAIGILRDVSPGEYDLLLATLGTQQEICRPTVRISIAQRSPSL